MSSRRTMTDGCMKGGPTRSLQRTESGAHGMRPIPAGLASLSITTTFEPTTPILGRRFRKLPWEASRVGTAMSSASIIATYLPTARLSPSIFARATPTEVSDRRISTRESEIEARISGVRSRDASSTTTSWKSLQRFCPRTLASASSRNSAPSLTVIKTVTAGSPTSIGLPCDRPSECKGCALSLRAARSRHSTRDRSEGRLQAPVAPDGYTSGIPELCRGVRCRTEDARPGLRQRRAPAPCRGSCVRVRRR